MKQFIRTWASIREIQNFGQQVNSAIIKWVRTIPLDAALIIKYVRKQINYAVSYYQISKKPVFIYKF